ncbi:hypothetical protein ABG067_006536 [Albugo candida]
MVQVDISTQPRVLASTCSDGAEATTIRDYHRDDVLSSLTGISRNSVAAKNKIEIFKQLDGFTLF